MRWPADELSALGGAHTSVKWELWDAGYPEAGPPAPHATASGAEEGVEGTLAAKAQRLADLQAELQQLERLPSLPAGALDSTGDAMAAALPPAWHERVSQLECEIEQLREEMTAEEAEALSAHPRAAEEVGRFLLEEREDREEDEPEPG